MAWVSSVGAVSTLGTDWPSTWDALLRGEWRTGIMDAGSFGVSSRVPIASVRGIERALEPAEPVIGAALRLAGLAARDACRRFPPMPMRVYGGSTHGESDAMLALVQNKTNCRPSLLWQAIVSDPLPAQLAGSLGVEYESGPWVYSSCTSGVSALCAAVCELRREEDESWAGLVVAVDALSALGVSGFARSGAATAKRCNPFRANQDGTVVAEGAAAMVVTAKPIAGRSIGIMAIGLSCDAGHPTRPDATGAGIERAIEQALNFARLDRAAIHAVILHGSGTPANDVAEAMAIVRTFGPRSVPATSVKGSLGHTMAGAGLFNCLVACETCRTGLLPPTVGEGPLLNAELNLIIDRPRQVEASGEPRRVLALCSGFGGNNAAILFGERNE